MVANILSADPAPWGGVKRTKLKKNQNMVMLHKIKGEEVKLKGITNAATW